MKQKDKLATSAERLLDIIEQHTKDLPAEERDAKWLALNRVVAKARTRAKLPVQPRTLETPRAARRRA